MPPKSLPPGGKVPSVCEADEGAIIERFLCRAQRPGAPILEVCAGNFAAAAATYFAHGGSSSQSPLHCVSAWRRKLRSFPCSSSSRRTRFAGLRREQRGIGQNAAGDGSDEHFVLIVAYPTPSGPSGHLPLTGGVGPGPPLRGTRTCWILQYFRRAKSERLFTITSGPLGPGFAKIAAGAVPLLRLAWPSRCLLVHCLRAGLGPAPTLKTGGFQICRRGGCPHPPVPNRVSFLGGPASVRPLREEGTALVFTRRGGLWPPESLPPSRGKVAREA